MNTGRGESHERYMRDVQAKIDENGWCIQGGFDPDGDRGKMWCYTVGLDPEFIMTGMHPSQCADLLNLCAARIVENEGVKPGDHEGYLADRPIRVRTVIGAEGKWMPVARSYRRWSGMTHAEAERFDVVQLFWPDEDNRFPGETGYDGVKFPQPIVGQT